VTQPALYPPQQPAPGQPYAPAQPYPQPAPGQPADQQPAAPYPAQQPAPGQPADQQPAAPYPAQPYAPAQPYPAQQPTPAPPKRKSRVGLIVGIAAGVIVLLAAAAAVWFFMLRPTPALPQPLAAYAPVGTGVSAGTTPASSDTADIAAAEDAVVKFYQAIDAGDFAAARALVTSDTATIIDKGGFAGWKNTTFEPARGVVGGDIANVFGHESHKEFGSSTLGVEFMLVRDNGAWLIKTWQPVDEATINGTPAASGEGSGATTLDQQTASDVVSTLLKARQQGDSTTIRMLTTSSFQQTNGSVWLGGIDNSPYFTKFTIQTVKASGATFVVTVREQWNSGPETATYTVVEQNGTVLVDTWTSK
jgi:hypothetical protein